MSWWMRVHMEGAHSMLWQMSQHIECSGRMLWWMTDFLSLSCHLKVINIMIKSIPVCCWALSKHSRCAGPYSPQNNHMRGMLILEKMKLEQRVIMQLAQCLQVYFFVLNKQTIFVCLNFLLACLAYWFLQATWLSRIRDFVLAPPLPCCMWAWNSAECFCLLFNVWVQNILLLKEKNKPKPKRDKRFS